MNNKSGRAAQQDEVAAYHHGDLRQSLLEAAGNLLSRDGIDAVGMREIARRAGVSHAAPYRHYANREALLADLASIGFDQLERRFLNVPAGDCPRQRFIEMACSYVAFACNEPHTWRLMFGNTLDKEHYPELMRVSQRVLAQLRLTMQELGVPAPALHEAIAAWAMAHGVATLVLDHRIDAHLGTTVDPDALMRSSAQIFLAGLHPSG